MDATTTRIAEFAAQLCWDDVPRPARDAIRLSLFDTVGCAIGGRDTPTSRIARRLTPAVTDGTAGRVVGRPAPDTTLEAAAFANGVMIRDLDFNDCFPGGHPSDSTGALLAVAEHAGADVPRLLTATTIAYEVFIRLCVSAPLKQRGWDQGFGVCIATAAALGNLLGLDRERIGHAIAMAGVAHLPMRATKSGALSLWKGAATAHAARCTLACTLLAAEGLTGPEAIFEGRDGLWQLVTGPFTLQEFGTGEPDFVSPLVSLKYHPVCYGLQAPVAAAELLGRRVGIDDITALEVETYEAAYRLNGSDPEKWDPRTRETADHSMPYAVVKTVADGRFDADALLPEHFTDPVWRPRMQRVHVRVAEDLEASYPHDIGVRLTATDRRGEQHRIEVVNPPGHEKNPLTATQVEDKFHQLVVGPLGEVRARAAAGFWRALDDHADLLHGLDLLAVGASATPAPGRDHS